MVRIIQNNPERAMAAPSTNTRIPRACARVCWFCLLIVDFVAGVEAVDVEAAASLLPALAEQQLDRAGALVHAHGVGLPHRGAPAVGPALHDGAGAGAGASRPGGGGGHARVGEQALGELQADREQRGAGHLGRTVDDETAMGRGWQSQRVCVVRRRGSAVVENVPGSLVWAQNGGTNCWHHRWLIGGMLCSGSHSALPCCPRRTLRPTRRWSTGSRPMASSASRPSSRRPCGPGRT